MPSRIGEYESTEPRAISFAHGRGISRSFFAESLVGEEVSLDIHAPLGLVIMRSMAMPVSRWDWNGPSKMFPADQFDFSVYKMQL